MSNIRRLVPGDEAQLDAFLAPLTASSMFLRSNLRRAGLIWDGEPFQAVYFGAFESNRLCGVISHGWNGNIVLQAPSHLVDLAKAILQESTLPVKGLIGPYAQANECLALWGLQQDVMQKSLRELLFELALDDLRVPQSLVDGSLSVQRSEDGDFEQLLDWHVAYDMESLSKPNANELRDENRESLRRGHGNGHQFVLKKTGVPVAMCLFNAMLDDVVQIGGVYTPPDLRGQGYARAVVAGALQIARGEGAMKGILFTGDDNIAAQTPYRAIGFQEIGDYYIGLFGKDARGLINGVSALPRSIDPPSQPQP